MRATLPLFNMDIESSTKDQDLATVPSHISAYDEETGRLERSGHRIARSMMILRLIIRILDFLSSIASAATMAGCLQQYFSTINVSNLGQMLWNPNSMIWPTVTSLAVSLLAIILSGIVLVAYFGGTAAADRWDDRRSYVNKAIMLVRVATSSVVTGVFYQTLNNPNSLQGQTCGVNGAQPPKQPIFPSFNFNKFCLMQNIAQYMMLAQVIMNIISVLTFVLGRMDTKNKEEMEKHKAEAPKEEEVAKEKEEAPKEKAEPPTEKSAGVVVKTTTPTEKAVASDAATPVVDQGKAGVSTTIDE